MELYRVDIYKNTVNAALMNDKFNLLRATKPINKKCRKDNKYHETKI